MEIDNTQERNEPLAENPEEVQPSSNTSDNVQKEKWFDWHLFPKEPIELKSFVEMAILLLIFAICAFLYYRWNTIPKRTIELHVEDLRNEGNLSLDSTGRPVDSLIQLYACNIKCCIPMTSHEEFIKDTSSIFVEMNPVNSDANCSDFIRMAFKKDSIRKSMGKYVFNEDLYIFEDSIVIPIMKKYGVESEYSEICKEKDNDYACKIIIDSLREAIIDSLHLPQDRNMAFCEHKLSLPYFSLKDKLYSYKKLDGFYITKTEVYDSQEITKMMQGSLTKYNPQYIFSSSTEYVQHWDDLFNIYKPFWGGYPMNAPSWGRLEDISQAYVEVKINTHTIDSIVLKMDFVGATEFSLMDPMPDKINMSSIEFNDPAKILKIRVNGLRFHAKFKELENWQEIRMFTVTAIMSAFLLTFILFFISSYFKLKKKKIMFNKNIIPVCFLLIVGFLLYYFVFFTIHYFYPNVLSLRLHKNFALFITFLLLYLFNKYFRDNIKEGVSILGGYLRKLKTTKKEKSDGDTSSDS